jgi:hypothetical protein
MAAAVFDPVKTLNAARVERAALFDEEKQCYVNCTTKARCHGVIPTMRRMFYPLTPQFHTTPTQAATTLSGAVSANLSGSVETKTSALHGRDLGIAVDQQLAWAVDTMTRRRLTVAQFLAKSATGTPLHSYTVRVLRCIDTLKWQPVACQVSVACAATGVATCVDMVCYNRRRGAYVVLEIKTGYSNGYDKGTRKLVHPFAAECDSPANQHQLQLLATLILFRRTFPSLAKTCGAALLRVDAQRVDVVPLRKWATSHAFAVAAALLPPPRRHRPGVPRAILK